MAESQHEQLVNAFIPAAVRQANQMVKRAKFKYLRHYKDAWDATFLGAMNELTANAGLRNLVKGKEH
jgi:hypothetical protein